ncbi:alanine--tRNA ligase [Candidatus Woesebacteria bacterium]|nr:alanine--tRNA ligase [Candidatus Woesebacteria bacterium]
MHAMVTPHDIRTAYLTFFSKKGHSITPSASLVPENDPTTLFTGSGMQPMIEYLLGQPHPLGRRIVDSQKCFRSQDIEEVGDNRHTTFFEMLGNWSLGDYFKQEQLSWFFTFLTDEIGIEPERLYVTVFRGNEQLGIGRDTESTEIWQSLFAARGITAPAVDFAEEKGLQGGRIFYYDEKKNWWSRSGVPNSMPAGEPGGPDSEVFYDFGAELKLHELSAFSHSPCHVNCDCGRFLEIGNSVFMQYQKKEDGSFRELSQKNVDFGGGLERIAAVAQGTNDIFLTELFHPITEKLSKLSGSNYADSPKTARSFRVIADHLRAAVFLCGDGVLPANKEQGYFLRRLVRRAVRYGKMIGMEDPFVGEIVPVVESMYSQSYPQLTEQLESITKILEEEEQKFEKTISKGLKIIEKTPVLTGEVAFQLYETHGFPFELTQEIAAERSQVLSETDFLAAKARHTETSRTASAGKFKGGLVDSSEETTKYHTATHLLHAALRKILGTHVEQKGSNITAERLRFDFSHQSALSEEEVKRVEEQVNQWIQAELPVSVQTMSKKTALGSGAIAFFAERYPDQVTVYTVGKDQEKDWISKELCGGPHVENTKEIGRIKIYKEQAVSAGVRRIYGKLVDA